VNPYGVNVQGNDIVLEASGNVGPIVTETGAVDLTVIGSIDNQTEGAEPKVTYDSETGSFVTSWDVDYEQVANYDKRETGMLTVESGGDVDVTEKSGDLGVNTIDAAGTVDLTAASISDARAEDETEPNITAQGVTLTADKGDIGSTDKPITIDTNGEGDTADDTVNAVARGDVNLTETDGDMRVGVISAGGDANLVVEDGDLVDADTDDVISKLAELLEEARVAAEQAESAEESVRLREETLQQLLDEAIAAQEAADAAQQAADEAQAAADAAQDAADAAQAAADAAAQQAQDLKDAEQAIADAQQMADDLAAAEQALADATDQDAIDAAQQIEDLRSPPGNRLHAFKGDRMGQYAISVNDQWRICFAFEDGDAYNVEICDYH